MSDAIYTQEVLLQAILPRLREPKLLRDGRYRAWCCFHGDGNGKPPHDPDLYIWPTGGFKCHGCNEKGTLLKLARHLGIQVPTGNGHKVTTKDEAMALLTGERILSLDTLTFFEVTPDLEKQAWRYPASLSESDLPYRYKAFPGSEGAKYWSDKGIGNRLYGLETIEMLGLYSGDAVVWANGEPAVWACFEAGVPAVCGIAGEGNVPPKTKEKLYELGVRRIIFPPDRDQRGTDSMAKVLEALSPVLIVEVRQLPDHLGEHADLANLWVWCGAERKRFLEELEGLQMREEGVV